MKKYTAEFFSHFKCLVQQEGQILRVELTPELAQHFGKSTLRLVFDPEHVADQTELVTYGSYISNRMYELVKHSGEKVSATLPKKQETDSSKRKTEEGKPPAASYLVPTGIVPYRCEIKKYYSREIRRTEVYVTFRVTYYSSEKIEEIVIIGIDFEGNLHVNTEFPYPPEVLKDGVSSRFPFTRKQAKEIYDKCLNQVNLYAEQQALGYQEKLTEHFHESITRLEAYYHQMIDEVPVLEKNREAAIRQLQDEYEIKTSDELKKCRIQISIAPISFCTFTIPFRRYRYTLQINGAKGKRQKAKDRGQAPFSLSPLAFRPARQATVNIYHNLFSGEMVYPRCESCGNEMKQVGVCEGGSHPVCHNCLVECHVCGTHICRECGIEVCFECGEWVCHQCSQQCHICGERYCTQHLLGCQICREHFCTQCAEPCEVCGKLVEKIHLTACEISYKLVCPGCIGVCSCCRKHVCQSYLSFCAFCGQQACAECTFRCEVCGETFCVHHISECEVTKHTVCPHHSSTCESCSRHVSIKYLNKCDVCGKKICTLCSTRCSHCHTIFCREDAGEMITCPECGKMYCALCYSTHSCHRGHREYRAGDQK
jgi:hypothetical protein